jgi:hypothetical protein
MEKAPELERSAWFAPAWLVSTLVCLLRQSLTDARSFSRAGASVETMGAQLILHRGALFLLLRGRDELTTAGL